MRKTIIIALLLIVSSFAFCQTKPDTAKKQPIKRFVPDLTKTITLQVKLPLYQVDNYIYTLQNPDGQNILQRFSRLGALAVLFNMVKIKKGGTMRK